MNAEEIEKITMGKFLTFEEDVMLLVAKGTDLLDAMSVWAERNGVEIESVAEYVKKNAIIKEKLRITAVNRRMMKKQKDDGAILSL